MNNNIYICIHLYNSTLKVHRCCETRTHQVPGSDIFGSSAARLPSTSIALRSIDPVRHGTPPQCCQDGDTVWGLVLEVVFWGASKIKDGWIFPQL